MATDTAPPVPEGPPDPPASPAASTAPAATGDTGIMAALMAAVEPARPVAATGDSARPADDDPAAKVEPDGVVDRSSPGVTSATIKAPEDLTGPGSDAAGTRYKEGVIKTLIRAGATRWAKGGGTANKRLDLEKTRASAHQVKEARTTTVMNSPGLPTRNGSGGASGGGRNSGGNGGGNSGRNSTGNGSTGAGRGGSGGANGGGGRGSSGSKGSDGSGGGRGASRNDGGGSSKDTSSKGAKDTSKGSKDSGSKGKDGSSGNAGVGGKAGRDGKAGASGSAGGSASGGPSGGNSGDSKGKAGKENGAKVDLKKGGGGQGSGGSSGSGGGSGASGGAGKNGKNGKGGAAGYGSNGTDNRTPLQRTRETGHGDGSAVRNAVDHVKAYAKGARDGYQDKKAANGKEHARLDKAHADHKAKQQEPKKDEAKKQGVTVTGPSGQTLVIAPPDEGDDGVSTDVKPLLVKKIDPNTLTLGTAGAAGSISRKELRNFKQYERKLEAKENHLIKVADACKSLKATAEDEATDCQGLADQAKAVEGGEKLAAKLTRLADQAKAQATEAAELHKRAKRAAEMCRVVLTNIGTRYAPLYKAVVDSDETKPAELRFYNDKSSYAPAA
ncbi:hypothetical protein CG747_32240 [Streptomyces sp. CB02959]|uniref:hypothetical protein n=1 Tax=Streptomyces sp. CB02959 TaxID=2020330 RepID=UPI000C271FAF|nr:hypothetical protein [Streptomyces sp. CB02959]PJN36610.1 hypothetical protein CG747_32240 [Streptomyces sp. CB02959]